MYLLHGVAAWAMCQVTTDAVRGGSTPPVVQHGGREEKAALRQGPWGVPGSPEREGAVGH